MTIKKGDRVRTTDALMPHWRQHMNGYSQQWKLLPAGTEGVVVRSVAASRGERPGLLLLKVEGESELVGVPHDKAERAP